MLVVEYERIEIDACADCGGTWFDAGEMALLLERLGVPEAERRFDRLLSEAPVSTEALRRCPLCRRRMRKMRVGPDGPVVDECVREEGIWFDRGEAAASLAVLAASGGTVPSRVAGFLKDFFSVGTEPAAGATS